MRAWALVENEAPLQEIDLPTPEPQGTEVLLETLYCGVCHSDIHIWEGRYDLGGGRSMNLRDRGLAQSRGMQTPRIRHPPGAQLTPTGIPPRLWTC